MSNFEESLNDALFTTINENGLSRLYRQTRTHDFGVITAFRYAPECGKGKPYKRHENEQRNASLLAKLRSFGFSVTAIKGSYIENYGSSDEREVKENSYFVVDVQDRGDLKNKLVSLGEEFEQDSVLFGSAGGDGVLIGTNHCTGAYPGYGVEKMQGGAIFGKTGTFMSRVKGRPFVFAEMLESFGVLKYPSELRGVVYEAKKHWRDLPHTR